MSWSDSQRRLWVRQHSSWDEHERACHEIRQRWEHTLLQFQPDKAYVARIVEASRVMADDVGAQRLWGSL